MQPGMPDLTQIVLRAQQMQDAVARAQDSMATMESKGSAGGGLVQVVVTGDGTLTSVTIDPKAVGSGDADDLETLGDLIVAAVRDATASARREAEALMAKATGGFDLGSLGLGDIPGLPAMPTAPQDEDQ